MDRYKNRTRRNLLGAGGIAFEGAEFENATRDSLSCANC